MYSVKKEFKFEYAHRLFKLCNTTSPCANIHGHSAKVFVEIEVENLDQNGMVIDFTQLKVLQQWLDQYLDHSFILNNQDPLGDILAPIGTKIFFIHDNDPTAEILAQLISKEVMDIVNAEKLPATQIQVTVYETAKNCASYTMTL